MQRLVTLTTLLVVILVVLYVGTSNITYLLYNGLSERINNSCTNHLQEQDHNKLQIKIAIIVFYIMFSARSLGLLKLLVFLPWNSWFSGFTKCRDSVSIRKMKSAKVRKGHRDGGCKGRLRGRKGIGCDAEALLLSDTLSQDEEEGEMLPNKSLRSSVKATVICPSPRKECGMIREHDEVGEHNSSDTITSDMTSTMDASSGRRHGREALRRPDHLPGLDKHQELGSSVSLSWNYTPTQNDGSDGEVPMERRTEGLRKHVTFSSTVKVITMSTKWLDLAVNSRRLIPFSRPRLVLMKLKAILLPSLFLIVFRVFAVGLTSYILVVTDGRMAQFIALDALTPIFAVIVTSLMPIDQSERFNSTKFILMICFTVSIMTSSVYFSVAHRNAYADYFIVMIIGSSIGNALYSVIFRNVYKNILPIFQDILIFISLPSLVVTILLAPLFSWAYRDCLKAVHRDEIIAMLVLGSLEGIFGEYLFLKSTIISSPVISSASLALISTWNEIMSVFKAEEASNIPLARKIVGNMFVGVFVGPVIYYSLPRNRDPLNRWFHNVRRYVTRGSSTSTASSNLDVSSAFSYDSDCDDISYTFSNLNSLLVG